jgi:hypothetical protein
VTQPISLILPDLFQHRPAKLTVQRQPVRVLEPEERTIDTSEQ